MKKYLIISSLVLGTLIFLLTANFKFNLDPTGFALGTVFCCITANVVERLINGQKKIIFVK